MLTTVIGIVAGAIIAILITVAVEALRRPKLHLSIAPAEEAPYPPGRPAKHGRSLTLNLANEQLPWFARWMSRSPALQCRGTVAFHNMDGERFFAAEMPLRFALSPQPIPMEIVLNGVRGILVDPLRFTADSRVDVYPGETTPLDITVKFDEEDECYGWSNLNYFSDPPWRHTDWKLPKNRYLISVTVFSSGQKCIGLFRLFNEAGPKDFRLEPALSSDKVNSRPQSAI